MTVLKAIGNAIKSAWRFLARTCFRNKPETLEDFLDRQW